MIPILWCVAWAVRSCLGTCTWCRLGGQITLYVRVYTDPAPADPLRAFAATQLGGGDPCRADPPVVGTVLVHFEQNDVDRRLILKR